ncbi:MAG: hypothetical protein QOF91_1721 [Alphaproteobacteria bacterium]|jgi:hypothetical protein|nr:hypothetical protein [Alphaproteobacteria bacterium]MEA3026436.1 hypothetical protein [Alphaproteobacteria bacterium]
MFGRLAWALMFPVLLAAAGQARAQEDVLLQRFYASVAERTQAEYEFNMAGITRQLLRSGAPVSKLAPIRERMKMLSYNRAVIFAVCAADAEKDRPPGAEPIPFENNLLLTTCVEVKVGQLQKFSQLAAYADFFFPDRIASCGEQARLPEQEKKLQPFAFLEIAEPKLYDFSRYNECLLPR